MDREIQGISDALEIIESLFYLPQPRRLKCETLFRLARRATGHIVELGTFHGNGYIALSLGADPDQQMVYTIDDYSPKAGWAGESYGPDDKQVFEENCYVAGIAPLLINKSSDDAVVGWEMPIDLLFWDLGCENMLDRSMGIWESHIQSGGILAIHDTYSNLFGAKKYMEGMVANGKYCQYEVMPGGVHVAVKR